MSRVVIALCEDERDALVRLALLELRTPSDQIRFVLRAEFERRGLLVAQAGDSIKPSSQSGGARNGTE